MRLHLTRISLIYLGVRPRNGENVSPRLRHVRVLQLLLCEATFGFRQETCWDCATGVLQVYLVGLTM